MKKLDFSKVQMIVIQIYLGLIIFRAIDWLTLTYAESLALSDAAYYAFQTILGLAFWVAAITWLVMLVRNKENRVMSAKNILIAFLLLVSVVTVAGNF